MTLEAVAVSMIVISLLTVLAILMMLKDRP